MIEGVADYRVLSPKQRLKQTAIGVKTAPIQDRIIRTVKSSERGLEFFMDLLRSTNKSNRSQTESPTVQRLFGGLNHFGMIRQPKIIVRTKIQNLLSIARPDMSALRSTQKPFSLIKPLGAN